MLNIAVCDDDAKDLRTLIPLIQDFFDVAKLPISIFTTTQPEKLLKEVKTRCTVPGRQFRILLLDLEMPHMHGFQVASRIRSMNSSCAIIFVTTHTEEIYNAFHYGAHGFISKSSLDPHLKRELKAAMEHLSARATPLALTLPVYLGQTGGKRRSVIDMVFEIDGVTHIEALSRELLIHYRGTAYPVRHSSFASLTALFEGYGFMKIFRSLAIDPSKVTSVGKDRVTVNGTVDLPLNKAARSALLKALSSTPYLHAGR